MNSDICLCAATRGQHPILGACVNFRLDRKATWAAEKGQRPMRLALTLTGCGVCKDTVRSGEVSFHKNERGELVHTGCKGPAVEAR